MTRRQLILASIAAGPGVALAVMRPRASTYESHRENILGTSFDVKLLAASSDAATRAEEAVLAEIGRLDRILSGYDPDSEFSTWARTMREPRRVSRELFEVLNLFDAWRTRTGGAVDASAEVVSDIWRTAATDQALPSDTELAAAVGRVRQTHWTLDATTGSAMRSSDAPLILNSFAKSYIIDRAARAGEAVPGISGIMVNIGGDLVVRGNWSETVAVTDPRASADNAPPLERIDVRDRAVATSGGYRRGVEIDGHHYSHIVDPRTGRATGHVLGATVVTRQATNAGALATAFCVLSPSESSALASTIPGVEFLLVLADGSRIESAGWRALTSTPWTITFPRASVSLYAAGQATWDPGFELTVSLELARPGAGATRPYVAVWIEDKDRFPVRTLAVWYERNHSKWLADLRAWYRGDRLRSMAEGTSIVGTVSSATRSPGRYSLVWDGKDNQGRPVKAGAYTVYIEAAREHGTYQLIKQAMDFPGGARQIALPGNIEIAAASLDYHPISTH